MEIFGYFYHKKEPLKRDSHIISHYELTTSNFLFINTFISSFNISFELCPNHSKEAKDPYLSLPE